MSSRPDQVTFLGDSSYERPSRAIRNPGEGRPGQRVISTVFEDQKPGLGTDGTSLAVTLNNLANLYQAQRKYDQAEQLYKRALQIGEQALVPAQSSLATTLNKLAS
ncbi:MAG: tetratricopeptide repeat protein [Deltaproteobacteria bacterium]|nr:tetratricopeptide repeat protein [Deltaproteobacteria bacterium]